MNSLKPFRKSSGFSQNRPGIPVSKSPRKKLGIAKHCTCSHPIAKSLARSRGFCRLAVSKIPAFESLGPIRCSRSLFSLLRRNKQYGCTSQINSRAIAMEHPRSSESLPHLGATTLGTVEPPRPDSMCSNRQVPSVFTRGPAAVH